MLNRWNKLFAVAVLAVALPVVANAQSSRVAGLSVQGDYIKDYTAIYSYPSQLSHVGNLVYGEFGDGSFDRGMGAVLGNLWDGRYGTWGIHMRQTTPNLGQSDQSSNPGIGSGGADFNTNNYQSFDIMWGKRMGGSSVGLRMNRSFGQSEWSTPTQMITVTLPDSNNFQRNIFGFGGGISFEINPQSTFEGSILWQSRTYESTANPIGGNTNVSEDNPTSYQLAARVMWQWQPNVMVMPVFKYYSFDYSSKVTVGAATNTANNTQKGWQFGAAGNWTLNQNDLFVLGFTVARNTVDQDGNVFVYNRASFDPRITIAPGGYKSIEESIYPQFFSALETHVNPWLTLRFGASQDAYVKTKAEPHVTTDPKLNETFTRFNMDMGAGVKVGGLQFDATLASNAYNRAGSFFSGGFPAFPKVTATYSF